ncbi:sensor histidine kinase [Litorisediminicola beolgyonensis]|uniref:histidine kinase n=1 Tax=Litorisediminicola beolgyonensis TaxID=1173614 RepID=A0ABW3ZNT4_9RHOB
MQRALSRLLRSAPLRLTLLLVTLFTTVNAFTLGTAYLALKSREEAALQADLEAELGGLDLAATPAALRTLVSVRARATDPADRVLVFLGDDGRQAGNARARVSQGQVALDPLPDRPLGQAGYLTEARRLSSGWLVVAESRAPVRALGRTFAALLLLSFAPTLVLSLALGTLIARRTARRVARIERTLDALAQGDLSARTGTTDGRGDDLARISAELDRMAARQEAATDALRQVSTDIAHDLRTPLQRITVLLRALEEETPPDSPARATAERAADEADRAIEIFRALLQIARIEGGQEGAPSDTLDLAALAADMVELYEPAAESAGLRLGAALPETPVLVTGEKRLIGQAIANLIENALRHGGAGPVTVSVDAEARALSVADHGPGIPEDEREKVLQRLYRLERSRTSPGHGLGLALVAAIAQRHGARLVLEDNAPGLRVTMGFPPPN